MGLYYHADSAQIITTAGSDLDDNLSVDDAHSAQIITTAGSNLDDNLSVDDIYVDDLSVDDLSVRGVKC